MDTFDKPKTAPIFITGIGTNVGKTVVSAIVTEALNANYWKPIQAGFEDGTDAEFVRSVLPNEAAVIYPEVYKLQMPASPHIAARAEGKELKLELIKNFYHSSINKNIPIVVEGAGGLLVPINNTDFVIDIIEALQAKVILVSRNYLGSINHSLLTAQLCKARNIEVLGWIFNDQYLQYEQEIVEWSGYPYLGSIPFANKLDKAFVEEQASLLKASLSSLL